MFQRQEFTLDVCLTPTGALECPIKLMCLEMCQETRAPRGRPSHAETSFVHLITCSKEVAHTRWPYTTWCRRFLFTFKTKRWHVSNSAPTSWRRMQKPGGGNHHEPCHMITTLIICDHHFSHKISFLTFFFLIKYNSMYASYFNHVWIWQNILDTIWNCIKSLLI